MLERQEDESLVPTKLNLTLQNILPIQQKMLHLLAKITSFNRYTSCINMPAWTNIVRTKLSAFMLNKQNA